MKLCIVLLFVAFGLTACGGGESDRTAERPGTSSGTVPFDRAFIDAMVPHHQAAIEMARDAKTAGLSQSELVTAAGNIIAAQRAEISQMLEWRKEWYGEGQRESEASALAILGLTEEDAGMAEHDDDLGTSADVDRDFAAMMITHHRGAIKMAELALERGGHQEIRDLAEGIIATQRLEIETMQPHAEEEHH